MKMFEMVISAFIGLIGLGPASRVFKQQQPKLGITVRYMTVRSGQMFPVMRTSHVSTWQPIKQLISILLRLLTNQSPRIDYRAERCKKIPEPQTPENPEKTEKTEKTDWGVERFVEGRRRRGPKDVMWWKRKLFMTCLKRERASDLENLIAKTRVPYLR